MSNWTEIELNVRVPYNVHDTSSYCKNKDVKINVKKKLSKKMRNRKIWIRVNISLGSLLNMSIVHIVPNVHQNKMYQ